MGSGGFLVRFSQVRYQVVILEELFAANDISENVTLQALQAMSMGQRRHSTIILFGNSFQTVTPIEAFQHSVHAVINASELFLRSQPMGSASTYDATIDTKSASVSCALRFTNVI